MTFAAATEPSRIIVVVGVDFTNVSPHLIHQTAALVRTVDEPEIHVVHVVKPDTGLAPRGSPCRREGRGCGLPRRVCAEVVERLCEPLRRVPSAKIVMHTPVGDPAVALARIAEEVAADVLVVEAHAQHGIARVFHRSLVNQLAGIAPCTVLAIRAKSTPARRGLAQTFSPAT